MADLDDMTRAAVDGVVSYFEEHGRAAALPDVRHRIQTSKHYPDMSELRIDIDRDHVFRVLVGFGPDDQPVLLIAGNKAGVGNAWYDTNVPLADTHFDAYLGALSRSKEERQ
jgi:hypothetical protein